MIFDVIRPAPGATTARIHRSYSPERAAQVAVPSTCLRIEGEGLAPGEVMCDSQARYLDLATMREIPESDPSRIAEARYDAFNRAHATAEDIAAFDTCTTLDELKAWLRERLFSASRRRDLGID